MCPSGSLDAYDVAAPPSANHAPPAYYMLFVTDNTGSYSRAAKVHLSASSTRRRGETPQQCLVSVVRVGTPLVT